MKKKCIGLAILIAFLNCYCYTVSGQYTLQINYPTAGNTIEREDYNNNYLKPAALIVPGTFLIYGALKPAIHDIEQLDDDILSQVKNNHLGFHTNIDNYAMWVPSASVYVLDAFKVNTSHSFKQHLLLDAGSIILTGGIGYVMRKTTQNSQVYNKHNTKFPSGHVANAFRGAEIFHQELKENNKMFSYSGYLAATTVGVLRIYNKVHLLTEVLAGAGLGIISTKLTYFILGKTKLLKRQY